MVEKSVKLSSINTKPEALASKPLTRSRNLKLCGNKGVSPSPQSKGDLAEGSSDICDVEVNGYINNKKEFLLKKITWEMMNPDYQKGKQRRKPSAGKRKDPIIKTVPSNKTSLIRTESIAESEIKKRLSSGINYDALEKLCDAEHSPKRAKLEKPVVLGDQMEYSQKCSEEKLLQPQCFEEEEEEEEEEPDWNDDYNNEEVYGGDEEFEDQDGEEDNEGVIW